MKFVAALSIRQTLVGVICLLSLVIAGLCGQAIWQASWRYAAAVEVTKLAGLNRNLFDALGSFRLERAALQSALILDAEKGKGSIETVAMRRKLVDEALAKANEVLAGATSPELKATGAQVQAGFDEFKRLRVTADAEIKLPVASRTKALPDTVMVTGEKLLQTLEAASHVVDGELRTRNPALSDLVIVRGLAWSARSAAGASGVLISALTAQARALEPKEITALISHDARALASWQAVRDIAAAKQGPQALREAVAKADATYFSGPLKEMKDAVVLLVSTGNKPNVGVDQWRNQIVPGLETIAAAASTALALLVESADAAASAALTTLAQFALTLLVALAFGIFGFMIVRSRVTAPIHDMTEVMTRLAAGDHAVTVPHAERKDEIGQMAGALGVFKDNLVKMAELESHERAESAARTERAESMAAVVTDVGAVVSAAARGDFSSRLQIDHPDPQMRMLVDGINEINGVVDRATTEFAEVMGAVAAGDLTRTVASDYRGRLADLAGAINDTVAKLSQTVQTIQVTASDVGLASHEIKTGADDLSQRTEQQASSLEETAATTEQLAASVKASAQASQQAATIAEEAKKAAEQGGAIAGKAVEAMSRIENASQKISEIIRVIDDIAFQTNLLALNAAVEAARAGDAGKGFAVVASEVRTLAQRSGEAAKDISGLISSSNSEVAEGVKLVRSAGESLKQILSASQKVAATIADISSASGEQANGIDEMSQAVAHMDEMTQQNAALAEESAASATALTQRIGQLNDLVAAFRTGQPAGLGHAPIAAARPAPAAPSEPERLRQLAKAAFEQQKAMPARAPAKPVAAPQAKRAVNGRAPVDTSWEEF